MNEVNRTMYIPLYSKAAASKKGVILKDPKAEEIWNNAHFELKGSAKSRWLSYYMAMRAAVFDEWLAAKTEDKPDAAVLHIGCGLDSRIARVKSRGAIWYDLDFPDVIAERKKYYSEAEDYRMLEANAAETEWVAALPREKSAVAVMEGISMYLRREELSRLFEALKSRFDDVSLLMDCYTEFGVRASKYKNPVNQVGVTKLYGIDDPVSLETPGGLKFSGELDMTPDRLINELHGFERQFFKVMFGGKAAKKIYRLYEYTG